MLELTIVFPSAAEDPNMANLEESFPRGGTRKLHKSEKSSQQVVEQDNLFDVSGVLFGIFGKTEPHWHQLFSSLFLFDFTSRN